MSNLIELATYKKKILYNSYKWHRFWNKFRMTRLLSETQILWIT